MNTMNQPHDLLARVAEYDLRAEKAMTRGTQAYARLLRMAEQERSGQVMCVARFVAATYDGRAFPLDVFDLRSVDVGISGDMLLCLDALRWARADLHRLVPDGEERVDAVIRCWALR
jgi:hypothetical protein